jgi:hypothetical protein
LPFFVKFKHEQERQKRISEGQTAIFAYPSALSDAKVHLECWFSKAFLSKILKKPIKSNTRRIIFFCDALDGRI